MTGRLVLAGAGLLAALLVLAALPLLLPAYQVSIAIQVLIFAVLAMSVDILAGYAGRTPLGHGALGPGGRAAPRGRVGRGAAGPRRGWRRCSRCLRCAPRAFTSCC